jgi:hypothetical protein
MLYLMIEGRYPWGEQPTMFAQYRCQLETPPHPAPGMPPGWEDHMRSALSPDPAQRPRSMHEFVYPLAVALQASPPHKSGLDILRGVARRWASSSANDETLRGGAGNTGAWRAAASGAWSAVSGSWSAASSGAWPVGSSPGRPSSGSWPATAAETSSAMSAPSFPSLPLPSVVVFERREPAVWKLVLWAVVVAALACLVVYALARALEGS